MTLLRRHVRFVALFLMQVMCMQRTVAFIVDTNNAHCDSSHTCSCSKTQINCNFKNLATIPDLAPLIPTGHVSAYYIHLSGNKFTTVSANTFKNFSSVSASRINLYLDSNKINTIADNAFTGIENTVNFLSLEYNNLTSLPGAIGKLTALDKLYLWHNPIATLDANAMSAIGKTLTYLWIGMGSFASWPVELGQLHHLKTLVLERIPSDQFMTAGALKGLGTSLTHLQLLWSSLTRLPSPVCDLQNLTNLIYNNNAKQGVNTQLFPPCMHGLAKLGYISLDNNQITTFPNVLILLPWAKYLSLKNNNISSIDSSQIPEENNITSFYMQHNQLSGIPNALNNLKHVSDLQLSFNHIASVNANDFSRLSNLYKLTLDHNPIKVISNGAFRHCPALWNLDVEYTSITAIPEDVVHLPKLTFLPMLGAPVVCNCSMAYLKTWDIQKVYFFTGFCNGDPLDQPLKHYISGELQNCP